MKPTKCKSPGEQLAKERRRFLLKQRPKKVLADKIRAREEKHQLNEPKRYVSDYE